MAAADVFVLPSTREGFSNAVIEALASGLPVVASDVGGNAEAVRDGVDGMIVPPLEVNRLEDALRVLWRQPERRAEMSRAAAQRAETFSIERMIAATERLYGEK
jgi:glycosyltransferase involved in cell wall biosynthesis